MTSVLLVLVWALPLLAATLAGHRHARWILVVAPLPAMVAAAVVPVGTSISLPWLLIGVELGLDTTGRVFLLFTSLLWFAASLFATEALARDPGAARFRVFFLLAMAGNLGLILAQDMLSFYFGFTLMGLAAYGLIAHPTSLRARAAARRYLVWTIAGELILFVAIVLLAQQQGGVLSLAALSSATPQALVVFLIIVGFGIKLALPGLHFWLPQAYAVTPTPAVAVLSGAMINAGLLGWLRFLPPGDPGLTVWGPALMVVGALGILLGTARALLQRHPRLVLGYSSISKMGVLTTGMGAALTWPGAAPGLIGALTIYAAHHALVKAGLFLGLGHVGRNGLRTWHWVGLWLLALALAGAPFTSGALAKSLLTAHLPQEGHGIMLLLTVAAFATTLVMARFLFLVWKRGAAPARHTDRLSAATWLVLLALIAGLPLTMIEHFGLLTSTIPVVLGAISSAFVMWITRNSSGNTARPSGRRGHRRWFRSIARRVIRLIPGGMRSVDAPVAGSHQVVPLPGQRFAASVRIRHAEARVEIARVDSWLLTGSLWLVIAGMLIGALLIHQ